ncbi:ferredoxin [Mycobacterium sp. NPDC003449]
MTAGRVRVELDASTCVGSTWCTTIAARVFVMGGDGKAHIADAEDVSLDALHEAEDSCPVSAIRVLAQTTDEGA